MSTLLLTHPGFFQVLLLFISILAGIAGSILGLGGGMFIVPILTLFFGVEMKYAVGASIISVIATSSGAGAGHLRDHFTNVRLGIFLAIAASIGAFFGILLSSSIQVRHVFLIFSIMLFISPLLMIQPDKSQISIQKSEWLLSAFPAELNVFDNTLAQRLRLNSSYFDPRLERLVRYSVSHVLLGFVLMMIIGLFTGLLGISCGALRVPAMDKAMRVPIKVSAATSNFMIGITSTAGALTLLMKGLLLPYLVAPVAIGVLIGSWGGAKLLVRLPSRLIHQSFVGVLLIMAAQMGYKTWRLYYG